MACAGEDSAETGVSVLQRLQSWYLTQCNGEWEHEYGIRVQTLDNPGWMIKVNLQGTSLEGVEFRPIKIERSEQDWLHASRTADEIRIACGPQNLEEAIVVFCDWAGV